MEAIDPWPVDFIMNISYYKSIMAKIQSLGNPALAAGRNHSFTLRCTQPVDVCFQLPPEHAHPRIDIPQQEVMSTGPICASLFSPPQQAFLVRRASVLHSDGGAGSIRLKTNVCEEYCHKKCKTGGLWPSSRALGEQSG